MYIHIYLYSLAVYTFSGVRDVERESETQILIRAIVAPPYDGTFYLFILFFIFFFFVPWHGERLSDIHIYTSSFLYRNQIEETPVFPVFHNQIDFYLLKICIFFFFCFFFLNIISSSTLHSIDSEIIRPVHAPYGHQLICF